MQLTTIGIDLAKNVFQIHGINQQGKAVLKKQLKREQMAVFFANIPPKEQAGSGLAKQQTSHSFIFFYLE